MRLVAMENGRFFGGYKPPPPSRGMVHCFFEQNLMCVLDRLAYGQWICSFPGWGIVLSNYSIILEVVYRIGGNPDPNFMKSMKCLSTEEHVHAMLHRRPSSRDPRVWAPKSHHEYTMIKWETSVASITGVMIFVDIMYRTGWWFGTCFIFPYIRNNHPNWRSYFSEGWPNHQPDVSLPFLFGFVT